LNWWKAPALKDMRQTVTPSQG
jgi:hypothetical protein